MKSFIKGFLALLVVTAMNVTPFLTPVAVKAATSSSSVSKTGLLSQLGQDVYNGKKIPMSQTMTKSKSVVAGKYVAFIKKDKVNEVLKTVSNVKATVGKTYGAVTAVPFILDKKTDASKLLASLDSNSDVVAVTQAVSRKPMAVSAPNDPKYPPSGNFTDTYQWYLNPSSGGNYGIDILSAWNYLQSLGKNWQGESTVKVAVLDTGVAYENYTKYTSWGFGKATDMTSNIYSNSGETANNGTDDDANGNIDDYLLSSIPYCLDANKNGQCDSPSERTKGYIDDKNGLSVIDYYWYWDPDFTGAAYCTNAPYTDYACVQTRYCENVGMPDTEYWGCNASDMGHPVDQMGHGTVVSNIISAKVNNSTLGTGIAPNVTIIPIQVFGYYYNTDQSEWNAVGGDSITIAQAIDYAVSAGASVINMSFGGDTYDLYEELAMNAAYVDDNVLLVASSGNTGTIYGDVAMYPASYPSVMSVGATNKDGTKASYSIYKSNIEISAPVGNGIPVETYTCYHTPDSGTDGNYCLDAGVSTPDSTSQFTQFSSGLTAGTSFAAPQVAAVGALLRGAYPTLSAQAIRTVLKLSSTPIGGTRYNTQIGYGILNASNAVKMLDSVGNDISFQRVLMQAVGGTDTKLRIRWSYDGGIKWTPWSKTSISSYAEAGLPQDGNANHVMTFISGYQGYLYQWRGDIRPYDNGETFYGTSVDHVGYTTASNPRELINNGRTFFSIRSTTGRAYTRYSDDYGVTWSAWNNPCYTWGTVNMMAEPTSGNVIQTHRASTGTVYSRYSTDNGLTWSSYSAAGTSAGEMVMTWAGGTNIVQGKRGTDSYAYTRVSTNSGLSWSAWTKGGYSYNDTSLASNGTKVVEAIRTTSNKLYMRYSTNNGVTWGGYINMGTATTKGPNVYYDSAYKRLFLTYVGSDGYGYTRYSDDFGTTWSAAEKFTFQPNAEPTFGSITYNNW